MLAYLNTFNMVHPCIAWVSEPSLMKKWQIHGHMYRKAETRWAGLLDGKAEQGDGVTAHS